MARRARAACAPRTCRTLRRPIRGEPWVAGRFGASPGGRPSAPWRGARDLVRRRRSNARQSPRRGGTPAPHGAARAPALRRRAVCGKALPAPRSGRRMPPPHLRFAPGARSGAGGRSRHQTTRRGPPARKPARGRPAGHSPPLRHLPHAAPCPSAAVGRPSGRPSCISAVPCGPFLPSARKSPRCS